MITQGNLSDDVLHWIVDAQFEYFVLKKYFTKLISVILQKAFG